MGGARWVALPAMSMPRTLHTATVLADGRVLVVGGQYVVFDGKAQYQAVVKTTASAEIYDPATETFSPTGSLAAPRYNHTATLLPNGQVLIAGGYNDTALASQAELFDPATGTFRATGALSTLRKNHTATLLDTGKVLIAGGRNSADVASCELYDPGSGTFMATGSMLSPRYGHTATLMKDGRVLMVGGGKFTMPQNFVGAEVYDPATGTFAATTGPLPARRDSHTATRLADGRVLIAGGEGDGSAQLGQEDFTSCAIYDPSTGSFTSTGSMATQRFDHTATLLPDGKVLIAAGENHLATATYLDSGELFDPATGTFSAAGTLVSPRTAHRAVVLGTGKVLLVGGTLLGGSQATNSVEVYDPAKGTFYSRDLARLRHTATLLATGKVLFSAEPDYLNDFAIRHAVLFDPQASAFVATGAMIRARSSHTATVLKNGTVLFVGSSPWTNTQSLMRGEVYDPMTGLFTATGASVLLRSSHTASLLPNGDVLVAGDARGASSTELYDASKQTFASGPSMISGRDSHTATVLSNGKVLLVGGWSVGLNGTDFVPEPNAELYDPGTGTFMATGALKTGRVYHTASLLPDGRVLIVGGWTGFGSSLSSATYSGTPVGIAELYDPATGAFAVAGTLMTARFSHAAATLSDGKILFAGGSDSLDPSGRTYEPNPLASSELYDPATGAFIRGPDMTIGRVSPSATTLANGKVLVVGGNAAGLNGNETVARAEIYTP